jgi:hypothetical protein
MKDEIGDLIEEGLLKTLDYCRYDMRTMCPDPQNKDCDHCYINPDSLEGSVQV